MKAFVLLLAAVLPLAACQAENNKALSDKIDKLDKKLDKKADKKKSWRSRGNCSIA